MPNHLAISEIGGKTGSAEAAASTAIKYRRDAVLRQIFYGIQAGGWAPGGKQAAGGNAVRGIAAEKLAAAIRRSDAARKSPRAQRENL